MRPVAGSAAKMRVWRLRDRIQRAGASRADLDDALAALAGQTRTVIGAPSLTAWGRRTG
jgi:hypothetical protein